MVADGSRGHSSSISKSCLDDERSAAWKNQPENAAFLQNGTVSVSSRRFCAHVLGRPLRSCLHRDYLYSSTCTHRAVLHSTEVSYIALSFTICSRLVRMGKCLVSSAPQARKGRSYFSHAAQIVIRENLGTNLFLKSTVENSVWPSLSDVRAR